MTDWRWVVYCWGWSYRTFLEVFCVLNIIVDGIFDFDDTKDIVTMESDVISGTNVDTARLAQDQKVYFR